MRQLLTLGLMIVLMGISLGVDRVYYEVSRQAMMTFRYAPLYVVTPIFLCLQAGLIAAMMWSALSRAKEHIPAAVVLLFSGTVCMLTTSLPGVLTLMRSFRELPFRVRLDWLASSQLAASPHTGAIVAATGLAVIVLAVVQRSQNTGDTTEETTPDSVSE